MVQVAGPAKDETIFKSDAGNIDSPEWSPDGQTILFVFRPDETRMHRELWALDMEKGTAAQLVGGSFNVFEARFAPNGSWYAYMSDETGHNYDVYLRPFPDTGSQLRVSAAGGSWPRWSEDGKELFYLNGEGHLVVVQVTFGEAVSVSPAEIITPDPITSNPFAEHAQFDVHPDGQRFLLRPDSYSSGSSQLMIMRDWIARLGGQE